MRCAFAICFLLLDCGSRATSTKSLAQLQDPATCAECHQQHYDEWSGSMHAYASDDPLFVALNQRAQDEAQVGILCVSCHAPMAVRSGATSDGTNLASLPPALKGVTCYFCHSVDQVTDLHNASLDLASDAQMRGVFSDPLPNEAHGSLYSSLHDRKKLQSSAVCGSCHDVVNGHGVDIERTFAEWASSVFATANGSTCAQCHMVTKPQPGAAANVADAPVRDLHDHQFPGVDLALVDFPHADEQRAAVQSFLDTTLQTALCVRGAGKNSNIVVIVENVAAGHRWPSGAAQDRRAWFEVTAQSSGSELYHGGNVPLGTDPTALDDPDLWLARDCMLDSTGHAVQTLWNATSVDSNLLPEQPSFDPSSPVFYQSRVTRSFPRDPSASLPSYPDRVTLDVHLLPFPLDLFDAIFERAARLGLDADAVGALRSKLVPLAVGSELTWTPAAAADSTHGGSAYMDQGVPVSCVTTTALNVAADTVPAPEHTAPACGN